MPVFITGATGYIGTSVVRELRKRSHAVRGLARNDAAEKKLLEIGAVPVRGDLRDLDLLRAEASRADAVIYAAQDQSADGVAVERAALEALLDGLAPGRAFVYTSGAWVYGSRGDALIAEDAPLEPLDLVAWRPAHERLVLAHDGRLRAIVFRPGLVYGDGGGIPGMLVAEAGKGRLRVVGDGGNRWPLVRHDALAELYAAAVENRTAHGVYNATRGAAAPYLEIAHAASRASGGDGRIEFLPLTDARKEMGGFADALACDLRLDSGKAARDLAWEPHRPTLLEELSNTTVI